MMRLLKSLVAVSLVSSLSVCASAGTINVNFAEDYDAGDLTTVSNNEFVKAHNGYIWEGKHSTTNNYSYNVDDKGVDANHTSGGPAYQAASTSDFVDGTVRMNITMDYITSGGFIAIFARNDDTAESCVSGRIYVKEYENGATQYHIGIADSNYVWGPTLVGYNDCFSFVDYEDFTGMPLDLALTLDGDEATFSVSYDWVSNKGNHFINSFSVSTTLDNPDLLDAGAAGFAMFRNQSVETGNDLLGGHITSFSTEVPEPASLALFGLGGLALLRRRK